MQVYKVGIAEVAIAPLASKIKSALNAGPTLWLLSGGSNIKLSVAVMSRIDAGLSGNLTVALADERFGPYNHPDSNWAQLMDAGFDAKNARLIEIIKPDSVDLESTRRRYASELEIAMDESDSLIGQLGMGSDGHIAGILPGSLAAGDGEELVIGYQSNPFTRLSVSFAGLRRLSAAFLIAFGEDKREQLEKLINQDVPLDVQPVQIIKQINEAYIYNDQVEGKQ